MNIKNFIPSKIRTLYINYLVKKKYDVIFEKSATSGMKTVFEGKNLLKSNAEVYSSYLGYGTYISGNTKLYCAKIGRYCSIGQNVKNKFGIHPSEKWVTTHPSFYSSKKQAGFTFVKVQQFEEHKYVDSEQKYHVEIGNDVWIGNDVRIMDGIIIGDGAIIASGAIVTKDIPPYQIVGGIPARFIRKRFSDSQIDFLLEFKWWNKNFEWIKENHTKFNSIENFIESFNKDIECINEK